MRNRTPRVRHSRGEFRNAIRRTAHVEQLESRLLLAVVGAQNPFYKFDVNNDTYLSPIDALIVINDINQNKSRPISGPTEHGFVDVNGDNFVSPIDALFSINELNNPQTALAGRLLFDSAPHGEENLDHATNRFDIELRVVEGPGGRIEGRLDPESTDEAFRDLTSFFLDDSLLLTEDAIEAFAGEPLVDGTHFFDFKFDETEYRLPFELDRKAPTVDLQLPAIVRQTTDQFELLYSEEVVGELQHTNTYELTSIESPGATSIVSVEQIDSKHLRLNLQDLLDDSQFSFEVVGDVFDLVGNQLDLSASVSQFTVADPPGLSELSPTNGEELVNVTRETIVRFDEPVDPATVNSDSITVTAGGEVLPGRIVVSSTERFATVFYDDPLPASTAVLVSVDGDKIIGRDGIALDADGNDEPGGERQVVFRTLPLTRIPDTVVFGFVRDSFSGEPIIGATIHVDAFQDANAVTDENGRFELIDMPAPEFFVHIDGSTATNAPEGFVYPNVGKPFHSLPGQTVQLEMDGKAFDVFLPPMSLEDVRSLSPSESTVVGFGASGKADLAEMFPDVDPALWDSMQVTFAPNAAIDEQGNPATEAAVIPVPPDRIPAPLPPNLNPQLVVSIQAGEASTFDVPAPVTFPNLEDLPPLTQTLILSFNHDAGIWDVVGRATVSTDGKTISSDAESGILAPGWHFVQTGTEVGPGGPTNPAGASGPNDPGNSGFASNPGPGGVRGSSGGQSGLGGTRPNSGSKNRGGGAAGSRPNPGAQPPPVLPPQDTPDFRYDHIEVLFKTFIPSPAAIANPSILPTLGFAAECAINPIRFISPCLHGGDDRSDGGRAKFSPSAAQDEDYRSFQRVVVSVDPSLGDIPIVGDIERDFGITKIYSPISGTPGIGRPWWWWNVTPNSEFDSAELEVTDANNLIDVRRRSSRSIAVNLRLHAPNPLIFGAPAIDANVRVQISQSEGRAAFYTVYASYDGFPAYELYLNGQPVIQHDPVTAGNLGQSPLSLFPPEEFTFFSGGRIDGTGSPNGEATAPSELIPQTGRHFYAILNLDTGQIEQRGTSLGGMALSSSVVLTPNTRYRLLLLQPGTQWVGYTNFVTPASGGGVRFGDIEIGPFSTLDLDGDGLFDVAELILGSDEQRVDTDADGISDLAEFNLGSNPQDGRGRTATFVSTVSLQGQARKVVLEGSTLNPEGQKAYVATGSNGLAVVDVSQIDLPVVLGQLNLPGDATDVAIDSRLRTAIVASNSGGIHLVDVSDPMLPVVDGKINFAASEIEVVDGIAYAAGGTELRSYDILTGELLNILVLGSDVVTGLAQEGVTLYAMDTANTLHAIDISQLQMVARGKLPLPDGGGSLFVGRGVAYATAASSTGGGFSTVDVSDLDNLELISGADVLPGFTSPSTSFVANGSGIGLLAGPTGSGNFIDVMDISDPTNTNLRVPGVPRFNLPAVPESLAIGAGIAFVAAGNAGLSVLNFLDFDDRGIPPSVAISSTVDLDLDKEGIQVSDGTTVAIIPEITDDVQVRNVELLVNGEVVLNDPSFPFELSTVALATPGNGEAITLQVRATDTGGNSALSNTLEVEIVEDTFAPTLVATNPADQQEVLRDFRIVQVSFSESMDTSTLIPANLSLSGPGGAVVAPLDVQFRADDRVVQLTYPQLSVGQHDLTIQTSQIKDRAGNAIEGDEIAKTFTVLEQTTKWVNSTSGFWDDPANWSNNVVPGRYDHVLIDVPGDITITHRQGDTVIQSLRSKNHLNLTGGTLDIEQTVLVDGDLTLRGGTVKNATVFPGGSEISVTRSTLFDSVTIEQGVTLNVEGIGHSTQLVVLNGLTLHGVIRLRSTSGTEGDGADASIRFDGQGHQILEGTGEVAFAGTRNFNGVFGSRDVTLVIGSGITIRSDGQGGILGFAGVPARGLINRGTIRAERGRVTVAGRELINEGTLESSGSTLNVVGLARNEGRISAKAAGRLTVEGNFTSESLIESNDGATIVLGGDWRNDGTIRAVNSTLEFEGTWVNEHSLNLDSANAEFAGSFELAEDAVIVSQSSTIKFAGTLNNVGKTLTWQSGWQLAGGEILGGTIIGEELNVTRDSRLNGVTLSNDGRIAGSAAEVTLTISNSLTLYGMLHLESLSATLAFAGSCNTESESCHSLVGNGEVVFMREPDFSKRVLPVDGSLTIGPDITIRLEDSGGNIGQHTQSLINKGTIIAVGEVLVQVLGNVTNDGAILAEQSANINLAGLTANNGIVRATDASLTWPAPILYTNNGLIDVLRSHANISGGPWINEGELRFTDSTGELRGQILFGQGSQVTTTNSTLRFVGETINNEGALTIGNNSTLNIADGRYTQLDGETLLDGGVLESVGTPVTFSGGHWVGSGAVDGNVVNRAGINIGGTNAIGIVTIGSDFEQTAQGIITVELRGSLENDIDRLIVSGEAVFGGTLTVDFIDGFAPEVGEIFTVATYASRIGEFDTIDVAGLPEGLAIVEVYDDQQLKITVVNS